VLLCQCGSDRVDIKLWNVRRAQLHCLTCGQEAWLEGFTVSDFDPAKLLTAAVIDQARKHRKRPPAKSDVSRSIGRLAPAEERRDTGAVLICCRFNARLAITLPLGASKTGRQCWESRGECSRRSSIRFEASALVSS
jgi:hypothetical protein